MARHSASSTSHSVASSSSAHGAASAHKIASRKPATRAMPSVVYFLLGIAVVMVTSWVRSSYYWESLWSGPSLEAEVLLSTPSPSSSRGGGEASTSTLVPSISDLLEFSASNNLTSLILQYLQTLRADHSLNPSVALSSKELHYGRAMQHLWELLKDMPLDHLSPAQQAEVWERIASPIVKLFLVDAEYIDRGLSAASPIGSQPPIFIVGFPRSGLSYLQSLIALDRRIRAPLIWEAGFDVADYREKTYKERQAIAEELMHRMQVPSNFFADSLCDDSIIRENSLTSNVVAYELYSGPEMIVWSRTKDVVRRQLQFHRRWAQLYHELTILSEPDAPPPQFWLFKGVDYVEKIEELLEVYPDARIIWVHNHIKEIIRKQLQESISLFGTGVLMPTLKYLRLMGQDIARSLFRLDALPADQLFHVQFAELKQDPIEMVRRIYDQLGYGPLTAEHELAMQQWLDNNVHESKLLQVSWSQALRLLGLSSDRELLDVYHEYLRRFPENI